MSFSDDFQELTGNRPFPWQEALYQRFMSGRPDNIPSSCNLPTGLGKTSVVVIWLIALANRPELTPRRLVYVVNRRTVVDQTTIEVETIRQRLGNLPALKELRQRLVDLCALSVEENQDGPISISTLRGQFADNRRWSADPARPSVIVGTVDMIGSRLLFGGYGVGFKSRPSHAGLLGQDALLVHDEAHLEPAFQKLLMAMKSEQERCGDRRRLRVMELSATTRDNSGDEKPFTFTLDDHKNRTVLARIKAKIRDLILHLIAAHHGRARSHFPDHEAFDPQHPESAWSDLAMEVPQRFARLQRRYGRWGLAWLESLVRAADALASQDTPEVKT